MRLLSQLADVSPAQNLLLHTVLMLVRVVPVKDYRDACHLPVMMH